MIAAGLDAFVDTIDQRMSIPVTRDPQQLQPPCVFVDMPTVTGSTLSGGVALTVPVHLVVPGPGGLAAADLLYDHLPDLLDVCGADNAAPSQFTTDAAEKPLPAMTIQAVLEIDRS